MSQAPTKPPRTSDSAPASGSEQVVLTCKHKPSLNMDNIDKAISEIDEATDYRDQEWESSYILEELRKYNILSDEQYASFIRWDASASVKRKTLLRWKQNNL